MNTSYECFPCFLNQAIRAGNLLGIKPNKQWKILKEVLAYLQEIDVADPPPKNAVRLYDIVARYCGHYDPYGPLKKTATRDALALYPQLKERVRQCDDPLFASLKLAVAGNVIDYGVASNFDLESELDAIMDAVFVRWDYFSFKERLQGAGWILYIGDNAGESVFDRLLIEELKKPVTYVVRGGPIINDVTVEDAREAGLHQVSKIVTSGLRMPGIDLDECSREFESLYRSAPLVISKGQGNFETLTPPDREIFFMFKIKCEVVARFLSCPVGGLYMGTF